MTNVQLSLDLLQPRKVTPELSTLIYFTPRTRFRWKTLPEWMQCAKRMLGRDCLVNHVIALLQTQLIEASTDYQLLHQIVSLIESQKQIKSPAVEALLNRLHQHIQSLKRNPRRSPMGVLRNYERRIRQAVAETDRLLDEKRFEEAAQSEERDLALIEQAQAFAIKHSIKIDGSGRRWELCYRK